ncbi:unnamed protein product [Eruca vesicaria subsp. sativa]|uniref:Legume lectin domain-containing protein n=1 Tax=Eruca vesicaria subsp. sativa TaxID=29727 RepID=A0ABC8LEY4_ERUVS|nr:unnamed protein product [Eruca vesicaria subsp. sativa]
MTQLPQPDLSSSSYPSHISSITIVVCSGHATASGGSDDTIHLYDLPSSSSLDYLLDHNHTASITALSFYTPSSLSISSPPPPMALSRSSIPIFMELYQKSIIYGLAPVEVKKPSLPLLSQPINLSDIFLNRSKLFVGFSAATGNAVSDHYILWWSFSTRKGESSLDLTSQNFLKFLVLNLFLQFILKLGIRCYLHGFIALVVCVVIMVLAVLAGVYFHRRKKFQKFLKHGKRSLMRIGSLTSLYTKQQKGLVKMSF